MWRIRILNLKDLNNPLKLMDKCLFGLEKLYFIDEYGLIFEGPICKCIEKNIMVFRDDHVSTGWFQQSLC